MMHKDSKDGFLMLAYAGDGAVLLVFDVDPKKIHLNRLAGFSVWCRTPHGGTYAKNEYYLPNKVGFTDKQEAAEDGKTDEEIGSDLAPFQTFHWTHMPGAGPGKYRYIGSVRYFGTHDPLALEWGPKVTVDVDLTYRQFDDFELGFTRGLVSSQAYADRFQNHAIRPEPNTIDYDTKPYLPAYQWLGAHGRQCLFQFLNEAEKGNHDLDVFAYDLDEPDFIRLLCKMGKRVRVFLDDYVPAKAKEGQGHGPGSLEDAAAAKLTKAKVQVKRGHFARFAHEKVLILKKGSEPVKVLTGSANFSVRGLYVQSNSILVLSDPNIAATYEQVFEEVWTATNNAREESDPSGAVATAFRKGKFSQDWVVLENHKDDDLPRLSVSFSPHRKPKNKTDSPFPLKTIADAVAHANRSVFFALMEAGEGAAIDALNAALDDPKVLCIGVTQSKKGFNVRRADIDPSAAFTSFSFLDQKVPKHFQKEWRGGEGQVIHHKFVVCDFNGPNPVVFCGSSNLARGGEEENGDNLLAIYDPDIATYYAVEALRLFDHYHFRSMEENAASPQEILLDQTANWAQTYFDPNHFKCREREILAGKQML